MEMGFTTAVYVIAAILFILSLGGLSGQESAKRAVWYGIVGMALAVTATLFGPGFGLWGLSLALIAAGGLIGYQLASKVEMTQMPELVAGMHALVGLAAVFVAGSAFYNPEAFDIGAVGSIPTGSLIEMALGTAIGAITFTGSIIAFGKLQGIVTGNPLVFKGQHFLNLIIGFVIIGLIAKFCIVQTPEYFWLIVLINVETFVSFEYGTMLFKSSGTVMFVKQLNIPTSSLGSNCFNSPDNINSENTTQFTSLKCVATVPFNVKV